jgi:archaellum component FlaC
MSETATREDIDEVIDIVRGLMQQVDNRFDGIEKEIIELKKSHNRLLNTIDGFIGRIDKYETELAARDNQFEKLLVWARKVSKKTGIPLENL